MMSAQTPEPARDSAPADAAGAANALNELSQARDALVSAQEEAREARNSEMLLRGELQHQVRNMLAIIRSIFARTVASGGSLEEVADHFRGRLDAIARYQSLQASDPRQELDFEQHILREELQSFQFGDDPRIGIAGPEVLLRGDLVQLIGLAIHELVTNSIKFGVLASPRGRARLEISWELGEDRLEFEWREQGLSMIAATPPIRGFGREFIEQALPYQIGAETHFELRPGGVSCRIAIPLSGNPSRFGSKGERDGSLGGDQAFA
jgi:two-component sensor histidine kinase